MTKRILATTLAVGLACLVNPSRARGQSSGIVDSVVAAPVSSDGDVAGRLTDMVINLDRSLDPSILGRGLAAGRQIRVTLPADFVDAKGFDTLPLSSGCLATRECNIVIPLQGWPQNPVAPPTWTASRISNPDGSNTFVIEALQNIVPAPGVKQVHLLLFGFQNPQAGLYDAFVEFETGEEGAAETGFARIEIRHLARPRVAVTSLFNGGPPNPNSIYQQAGVSEYAPVPFQLLLWGFNGLPMTDVKLAPPRFGTSGRTVELVQSGVRGRKVGLATIIGPNGATGAELRADLDSFEIVTPISTVPTARFPVMFKTGDLPGLYTITFRMNWGNAMTFFVVATGSASE